MTKPQLIVALDVETFKQAQKLVNQLEEVVNIFKIGSQLFTAYGPQVVRYLQGKGKKVFLDLKFHDIPHTVAGAVKSTVSLKVAMLTVHTVGGEEMLKAAVGAAKEQAKKIKIKSPLILGVTVLTSQAPTVLSEQAKEDRLQTLVLERALLAQRAGLGGVVASVEEASLIRHYCGKDFIIATPGIRPEGSQAGDQKRIATPKMAIHSGSNYLVVGRPIVQADNPLKATQNILKEILGG